MTKDETLIDGVLVHFDPDHESIALDALETIADWKEDLRAKIRRALLRLELAGLGPDALMNSSKRRPPSRSAADALRGDRRQHDG